MSNIDDGGSAFPRSLHPEHGYGGAESVAVGMSYRMWLVGQVLPTLLQMADKNKVVWSIVDHAFAVADTVIAEEKKRR